ncbi:RNA-binding region-containing protein 3 [Tyrophagus putrescentiae]|nr:RNA-binding region-containing protein 3 [Tyrophagus putrescentiae]
MWTEWYFWAFQALWAPVGVGSVEQEPAPATAVLSSSEVPPALSAATAFVSAPVPTSSPASSSSSALANFVALQIRGLSPSVAYLEREHLLHGLGATTVHNAPFHSVAFFRSDAAAKAVIRRLHQRPWSAAAAAAGPSGGNSSSRNSLLRVEYFSPLPKQQAKTEALAAALAVNAHRPCDSSLKRLITTELQQCFSQKTSSSSSSTSASSNHHHSQSANFRFPLATSSIVHRISRHLLENGHFYEQVLLLMLRLGLHPPFDEDNPVTEGEGDENHLSNICLPPSPPSQGKRRPHDDSISSDESELETAAEEDQKASHILTLHYHPPKRRRRKKLKTGLVGEKAAEWLPRTGKTASKSNSSETPLPLTTTIEEVFEDVPPPPLKQLIKVSPLVTTSNSSLAVPLSPPPSSPLSSITSSSPPPPPLNTTVESQSFGTLSPTVKKPLSPPPSSSISFDLASLTPADLVTEQELSSRRLPPSEWPHYKVFAGYRSNPVCNRLYVKNLHRLTALRDLYRLFGRWVDLNSSEQLQAFSIVKLDKGRMRGQAFVSFPTEAAAAEALQGTNGYVGLPSGGASDELRPIVVNFALSRKGSADSGDHQPL